MKKAIKTTNAPAAVGAYNQAILSGDTLYISGQLALNPATGAFVEGDIGTQTHRVMQNLEAILKEAGLNFDHIVKCSIFLKNMDDFAEVNAAYASYFGEVAPARETVQVAKLPLDGEVEISAIAVK